MKLLRNLMLGAALLSTGLATAGVASAQTYPAQRITLVVPLGAGGVTDILARIFADEMSKRWDQPVVVENRPGLAGTASAAKAPPDGYTLMMTSAGITVSRIVSKDAPFDPVKDFVGITRIGTAPHFLIANPQFPAKTVKETVELAKAQPGKLNFSSPGLASTTFISGAIFRKATATDIVHVPFRSAPEAMTAVMRGDVQLYFAPTGASREQAEAGKVRILAALTPKRVDDLPDVPTATEAGYPAVYDAWFGLMAPTGTPKAIREKISKDWAEALKSPDVQQKLKAQFLIAQSDTPDAMDKIVRDDATSMVEVFRAAGIN